MATRLILASASPRRLQLLQQIGVTPETILPADIDETPHKDELPQPYALRMAREKCAIIMQQNPQDWVLAADTVVGVGRRILPKAEDEATARHCLRLLSGRRHQVFTAVALGRGGDFLYAETTRTLVQFKHVSHEDMRWYLQSGEWQDKAGGYAIQGCAEALVKRLDGQVSNVIGLPLLPTRHALQRAGLL